MANASERIDTYIENLPTWSREICEALRVIILKSDPKIVEDWKWGPNYYLNGMVCGFFAFKNFVTLTFFKGTLLKDSYKLLKSNSDTLLLKQVKYSKRNEINEDILLEYLIEAIDNNKEGKQVTTPKKKTIKLPLYIKTELEMNSVLFNFNSLSYSLRKEFILWIEDAKREETKLKRIEKMIGLLRIGETLNSKYNKPKAKTINRTK